jgi:hypothetical protein
LNNKVRILKSASAKWKIQMDDKIKKKESKKLERKQILIGQKKMRL